MQILLIRDTNGCHCRRYGKLIISKFPNPPCFGQKKVRACVIFLLPALWACDDKNFLGRLKIYWYIAYTYKICLQFIFVWSVKWRSHLQFTILTISQTVREFVQACVCRTTMCYLSLLGPRKKIGCPIVIGLSVRACMCPSVWLERNG